jgi:hypothetical protein
MSGSVQGLIASLPQEMLEEVLNYLDFRELSNISEVDKLLYKAARKCQFESLSNFLAVGFSIPIKWGYVTKIMFPPNLLKDKIVIVANSDGDKSAKVEYDLSTYTDSKILAIQQNIKTACQEEEKKPNIIVDSKFKKNKAIVSLKDEVILKFSTDENWNKPKGEPN